MSLSLDNGSKPKGTLVKTYYGIPDIVIGDAAISQEDFAEIVKYWFTNTDLCDDDIRIKLLNQLGSIEPTQGYNPDGQRLQFGMSKHSTQIHPIKEE